jgi:hypothetical protein
MTDPDVIPAALPREARAAGFRRWGALLGPAISLAIFGEVLWQVRALDWHTLVAYIPDSPLVWVILVISYLSGPVR